jgi:hypothetical protein
VEARASLDEGLFCFLPRAVQPDAGLGQEFCCLRPRQANFDCNLTTIDTIWKTPDGDQRHCRKLPKDTRHD